MDPVDALRGLGGSARWTDLKGRVPRRALARAVVAGGISHDGRTYFLPGSPHAVRRASELLAVRSHVTAAEHHGFALPPDPSGKVRLTVPYKARRPSKPDDVTLHYRDLAAADLADDDPTGTGPTGNALAGGVTAPVRTVVDCLRDEDLRTALSVGDSALASGKVTHQQLAEAVTAQRGPGSKRARDRLLLLDARAANAFESCARAILLGAGITGFQPQVDIRHRGTFVGRVDLAHLALRIVLECDGFETHGTLDAMTRDALRHTWLVSAGWRPLRLTWYQVMFHPDWVLERVQDTIAEATRSGITVQPRPRTGKPAAGPIAP